MNNIYIEQTLKPEIPQSRSVLKLPTSTKTEGKKQTQFTERSESKNLALDHKLIKGWRRSRDVKKEQILNGFLGMIKCGIEKPAKIIYITTKIGRAADEKKTRILLRILVWHFQA